MAFVRRIDLGDLRFALRYFARHRATTAIIVAVLALGTGANTVIFSFFQAEFLRAGPAVPDDDAHVRLWGRERVTLTASWQPRAFTHGELRALESRRETFRDVAGWTEGEIILRGDDTAGALSARTQFVTPNFFRALGVRLAAGQGLREAAGDDPDLTAVIAFAIAERLHGSAAAVAATRLALEEALVDGLPGERLGEEPAARAGRVGARLRVDEGDKVKRGTKLAQWDLRLYEVPISYEGRTYADGKKIEGSRPLQTTRPCNKCQKHMWLRVGKRGFFLTCPGYPKCRNLKPVSKEEGEKLKTEGEALRAQLIAARQAGLPPEKIFINIDRYGNTSAASIPLALAEAV